MQFPQLALSPVQEALSADAGTQRGTSTAALSTAEAPLTLGSKHTLPSK